MTIALVLWVILALIILAVATSAAHFSPWEFIVPQFNNPVSLISSSLLYGPPLLLAVARFASTNLSTAILWALVIALGLVLAAIVIAPIASAILR